MRAQKVALDYLDEALTKALEADKLVDAAQAKASVAIAETKAAYDELDKVKAVHKAELENFDKVCAEKLTEASAKAASLVADAHIQVAEVQAKCKELEHVQIMKEQHLESIQDSIDDAELKLQSILEEHDAVKGKLAAIKAVL